MHFGLGVGMYLRGHHMAGSCCQHMSKESKESFSNLNWNLSFAGRGGRSYRRDYQQSSDTSVARAFDLKWCQSAQAINNLFPFSKQFYTILIFPCHKWNQATAWLFMEWVQRLALVTQEQNQKLETQNDCVWSVGTQLYKTCYTQ